jgi:hypothetical protein
MQNPSQVNSLYCLDNSSFVWVFRRSSSLKKNLLAACFAAIKHKPILFPSSSDSLSISFMDHFQFPSNPNKRVRPETDNWDIQSPSLPPYQDSKNYILDDPENSDVLKWYLYIYILPETNRSPPHLKPSIDLAIEWFGHLDSLDLESTHLNNKETIFYSAFLNEADLVEAKKVNVSSLGTLTKPDSMKHIDDNQNSIHDDFFRGIARVIIKEGSTSEPNTVTIMERYRKHHDILATSVLYNPERKILVIYFATLEDWKKALKIQLVKKLNHLDQNSEDNNFSITHLHHLFATNYPTVWKVYLQGFPKTWTSTNLLNYFLKFNLSGVIFAAIVRAPDGNSKRYAFIYIENLHTFHQFIDPEAKWEVNGRSLKVAAAKSSYRKTSNHNDQPPI